MLEHLGITIVNCSRCGMPCKLADSATEDARLLKHATRPETSGYCPDCGVTDFFKNQSPLGQLIRDKDMLLASHVQTQFAKLMLTGNADARPEEINWQRVHDNWDLPFQKPRRAKRQSR